MSMQTISTDLKFDSVVGFLLETFRSYTSDTSAVWTATTTVDSIGIDSFDFVEILFKIEDHYGIDLDYNANMKFSALTNVGDLALQVIEVAQGKVAA